MSNTNTLLELQVESAVSLFVLSIVLLGEGDNPAKI